MGIQLAVLSPLAGTGSLKVRIGGVIRRALPCVLPDLPGGQTKRPRRRVTPPATTVLPTAAALMAPAFTLPRCRPMLPAQAVSVTGQAKPFGCKPNPYMGNQWEKTE